MNFIEDVSAEKLRGGFYTPPSLVHECFARLSERLGAARDPRLLEPAAGDGAFIRGIPAAIAQGFISRPVVTCVELLDSEAQRCRETLRSLKIKGEVASGCFFAWALREAQRVSKGPGLARFDAAIGNPPFVRYQFVPKAQRRAADLAFADMGKEFDGVANLWIPFILLSLELLRDAAAFAFVLPGELLATRSAGLVRSELVRHARRLRIDLHPRGSFAGLLQDVLVVSGQRSASAASNRCVTFVEDGRSWTHTISDSRESWTRYLLSHNELAAFQCARRLPEIHRLGEVASLEVAIVTGANDFFTVDENTLGKYDLHRWARPLLGRTSDSPGIVYSGADHERTRAAGRKAWILDFSAEAPDPMRFAKPREYLGLGAELRLPARYKCRIREPWYRVPDIRPGSLMMSKRAHQFHRLILNRAKVHTTDTIYRGHMRPRFESWERALVAGFHNSLTMLSTEIEGRSYGGGVLELVPSEISRLLAPLVKMDGHLKPLDPVCRKAGGQLDADDTLIDATDDLLCREVPALVGLLPEIRTARRRLRQRRFEG